MIITKCTDGLGNQLFQYALGRRLSILHHTDLFVDRTDFINNSLRRYCLDYFNVQPYTIDNYKNFASQNPFFYAKLKLGFVKTIKESPGGLLPIDVFSKNCFLKGYWGSEDYFSPIKEIIQKEFTIKDQLISASFKKLKDELSVVNAVSVHIRRGDYLKPKNKVLFENLEAEYYTNAIARISAHISDPTFYIFSDDLEWVKNNFTFFKGYHFVNEHRQLKDYEELLLMSLCKHHIIANSTFSWWAAWLNLNRNKMVIQPEKWYTDSGLQKAYSLNYFLYSKNFIRI